MRIAKLWPLVIAMAFVLSFFVMERTPPVRASFMLDGLIDCGRSSGQQCSFGDTLVLLTKDSGAPTRYTINISWLKPSDLDDFEQDDQVKIEIEKLPDGTLMALRIITNDNDGIRNAGIAGAKSTTTTTEDDDETVDCIRETVATTFEAEFTTLTTVTITFTETEGTFTTTATGSATGATTVTLASALACGESAPVITTTTTTNTIT